MGGFYNRLEEVQGVRDVLLGDVRRLERLLVKNAPVEIDSEAAGVHRHYVRAVFALIEAVVEHRLLLLNLSAPGVVALENGVAHKLSKMRKFTPLPTKIEIVYKRAGHVFGHLIEVASGPLIAAKDLRDRLTHPKTLQQCDVFAPDLDKVQEAEIWFRDLNNSFVKAAEQHRQTRDTWRTLA